MGINEFNQGLPLIYMIGKSETAVEVGLLIRKLLEWGNIRPKIIMSDCAQVYSLIIKQLLPNTRHLHCAWHIYRAWSNKLKSIYGKDHFKAKLQALIKIQKEVDHTKFNLSLLEFLSSSKLKFQQYFEKFYMNEIPKWASCMRLSCGINVNMHLESFHRLLKREFLKSKKH